MIILNNTLFACRPCILLDHGQGCTHVGNQGGIFSLSESILLKKPRYQTQPFVRQGDTFRLVACAPEIKDTITIKLVEDQELLFNKFLNVDTKKKIGKQIYILNNETPTLLQPTIESSSQINIGRIMHSMSQVEPFSPIQDADRIPKDLVPSYNQIVQNGETAPVIIRPLQKASKHQKVHLVKSIISGRKDPKISTSKPRSSVSFAESTCDIKEELAERESRSRLGTANSQNLELEPLVSKAKKFGDLRFGTPRSAASPETQLKLSGERSTIDNAALGLRYVFGPDSSAAALTSATNGEAVRTGKLSSRNEDLTPSFTNTVVSRKEFAELSEVFEDSDDEIQALIDEIRQDDQVPTNSDLPHSASADILMDVINFSSLNNTEDSDEEEPIQPLVLATERLNLINENSDQNEVKQQIVSNDLVGAITYFEGFENNTVVHLNNRPACLRKSHSNALPNNLEDSNDPIRFQGSGTVHAVDPPASTVYTELDGIFNFLQNAQQDMKTKLKSSRRERKKKHSHRSSDN